MKKFYLDLAMTLALMSLPILLVVTPGCNLNQVITQVRTGEDTVRAAIEEQIGRDNLVLLLNAYTDEQVADLVMAKIGPGLKLDPENAEWVRVRIVLPFLAQIRASITPEESNE